ncbi:2,4-dienoyl-CoA reductase [NADPH] [Lachnospiraceae bacterium KM106-2]|nr:2,4-dienoyl-CoA reductase [NADPH] [Lachnospiraceae bacterium KM106-2]
MKYEQLFKKGKIGRLTLKNRIVMTPMGVSLAGPSGEATEDIIRYYEERAKGGTGLIITEITRIDDETGVGTSNQLAVTDARHIPGLQRLADRIHKYDAKVFVQLHHPGNETYSRLIGGRQIVSASDVVCSVVGEKPRPLSTEEVEAMVKKFIKGAVIAKTAGIDGVEIHAAHGYLLDQFLSPHTNKRTDRYGGSFHNRIRILEEIITGIKYMCGPAFPVSVRISADEFLEDGLHLEDTIKIAKILESYGVDTINVSSGVYDTGATIVEPGYFKQGWKKHLATAIRQNVNVPVIAVNNIKEPNVAEQLLEEGVCDFIGLGRPQLADPAWANKAKCGKDDQIRTCIGCMHCFATLNTGKHIECCVNARTGREAEFTEFNRNGEGKTVAVIGGGPGGMEAARVLAERNYKVVLFEKEAQLGGTLNVADKPLNKEKITVMTNGMAAQLKALNVDVRLNTEATVDMVKQLNPAGVFVACGATPIVPNLPGMDSAKVVKAEDILTGAVKANGSVVVVGSGMTGLETAEKLAVEGHAVNLIEMAKTIGTGIYPSVLMNVVGNIKKHGGNVLPRHQLQAVTADGVVALETLRSQVKVIPADTVVLALGVRPRADLVEQFEEAFEEVRVIGDASKGGRIVEAIKDGYGKAFVF